jgi:uncharacterized protein
LINIGDFNNLKIARKTGFGYYLDAETGRMGDDILLPLGNTEGVDFESGDEVSAFIYRDSSDRIVATLKKPEAKVGDIAYLKVVSKTKIGSFISIGLERDVFVPLKEENFKLEPGKSYLFYIYVDKTGRLAATTFIDRYLLPSENYNIGDEVLATAYGYQTNGSVMMAVENKYIGVILRNEYFSPIVPGEKVSVRIKKIYEDGKLGLTPRKAAPVERKELEDKILEYLESHDGFMPFNDKSSPEEIKEVFHESKNYFKNALGGLMKQRLITQDEEGTRLIGGKVHA